MTDWVAPNSEYPPPKPGEPPLHTAARLGNSDGILDLIASGIPVDALFEIQLDPGGRPEPATPIMVAAGSNDGASVETVELLLELGASPDPGPSGVNALWYACAGLGWNYPPGGDSARVAALLQAGSDPNNARPPQREEPGISALARACSTGDPQRVKMMLAAGASPQPDGAFPPFEVPLYQAAESGSGECVSLLIRAGVDPNPAFEPEEDPPIASASSIEVVEALLEAGADPHAPCTYGKSIAHCLASQPVEVDERVGMLQLLIDRGVDIDQLTRYSTPLSSTAMNAQDQAVEALLKVGANPRSDPRPLRSACFLGFSTRHERLERVIDLLIDAGADPDEPDELGLRPLHSALSRSSFSPGDASSDGVSVAATIALLRRGASIDITFPNTGYRPLHAAADAASDELVSTLIAHGADPTELDSNGRTPAEIAAKTVERLSSSRPTIEQVREGIKDEARAQKLLRRFQQDHDKQLENAKRCVEILAPLVNHAH